MGVEVMADDEENDARAWSELRDLICEAGGACESAEAAGVREVVRMLRDAAESACDVHIADRNEEVMRLRRFVGFLSQAMQEIR